MAKKEAAPAPAPAAEAAPKKKGLPVKTIGIVGGMMAVEAVAVVLLFGAVGPKASHAEADTKMLAKDDSNEPEEVQIADDVFQNMQTGRVWMWKLKVFVQVKHKNADSVNDKLTQHNAEIKEGISQIISKAQHAQLKEPDHQTLNRQFAAFLTKIFGNDEKGEPLVDRVIIPNLTGMQADF